jgi:crotonobetainyl-CoA:carnitine CoA-transferase CaiB-like acyl-CoA transferase
MSGVREERALAGTRVVELASEAGSYAGQLLAHYGAEVIVIEPPGGHATRWYEPFVDDAPSLDGSLWWKHYNVGKFGLELDLLDPAGQNAFQNLLETADVLIEAEAPGYLSGLQLDYDTISLISPQLVWVSITSFGRQSTRNDLPQTDITLLAGGGPMWNCGYDDHQLPPVRGATNQAAHAAGVVAVSAAMVALLAREELGIGQLVDVSMDAVLNVSSEVGSYYWLVAGQTVQRQTGRHAAVLPSEPIQALTRDGHWVTTGVPPRTGQACQRLIEWMHKLAIADQFDDFFWLEIGVELGEFPEPVDGVDVEGAEVFRAERTALFLIAANVTGYEFFRGSQDRGFSCGVIYSPDEALDDPHIRARGGAVPVFDATIGREADYPAAPVYFRGADRTIKRAAPGLDEHRERYYSVINRPRPEDLRAARPGLPGLLSKHSNTAE